MSAVVTRWWLVRHAPVPNPENRITGQADLDCDVSDTAAFRWLAAALPAEPVWIATPLRRTRQTLDAIRAVSPLVEPDLMEQSFGAWEGRTYDAVDSARFWEAPATERPPGGESFAAVMARVAAAIERLTAEHAGRDLVAVVHAGAIRAALALALDLTPEAALRLRIDTLSLTRLDHVAVPGYPPAWRVETVNRTPG